MAQSFKSIAAILVDHFGLTLEEIGKLTDRQIEEIYFHPRTKEGHIEPKERKETKPTYNSELATLFKLKEVNLINQHQFDQLLSQLRLKYHK